MPGRRRQADTRTLVPDGGHEPGNPSVRADDRQVVRAVRPEPAVGPHERDLAEEREESARLRGQPTYDEWVQSVVESHSLAARPDQDGAASRALDDARRLKAGVAGGHVGDVVGRVDLVPHPGPDRRGDEYEPATGQDRDRRREGVAEQAPPRSRGVDDGVGVDRRPVAEPQTERTTDRSVSATP